MAHVRARPTDARTSPLHRLLGLQAPTIRALSEGNVFTITQRADTINTKFCLSFKTDNENIKSILIKVTDDATGISTIAEEGCLGLKGADTQGLTPMVIKANGEIINLMTLRLPQAAEVYNAMVEKCAVHPSSYQPINFKVPAMM